MAENTKIEWAHHTFNPWTGCTKISPACEHCYAEGWAKRTGGPVWGAGQERRRTSPANWRMPLRWNTEAERLGVRYRVFCASLADVFDNAVDREWRDDLATLILSTPRLDWLLLTKRIGNAGAMLGEMFLDGPPDNVWLGATITSQAEADRDIPKLLSVPAAKRFLSMEPLLGPVDLTDVPMPESGHGHHEFSPIITGNALKRADRRKPSIDWVIVGGESGPQARPMHPDWVRGLRDQCQAAGVPLLFKQWGEWAPGENVERTRGVVKAAIWFDTSWLIQDEDLGVVDGHRDDEPDLYRVGKKAAGRLLDGREWNEVPLQGGKP